MPLSQAFGFFAFCREEIHMLNTAITECFAPSLPNGIDVERRSRTPRGRTLDAARKKYAGDSGGGCGRRPRLAAGSARRGYGLDAALIRTLTPVLTVRPRALQFLGKLLCRRLFAKRFFNF